jgi:hypothetical protein
LPAGGERFGVDFYARVLVAGHLEVEDNAGREVAEGDFDPAPLFAMTFTSRF